MPLVYHDLPHKGNENDIDFKKLGDVMRQAALEAGAKIMDIYTAPASGLEVAHKQDNSPVTAADHAADRVISQHLRAAFPRLPLITEEQTQSHAQSARTFLIVDPLDGTKEFIQRRGEFTVNIAYVQNGVPLRGIVYAPALGRLFYTSAEGRAYEERIHPDQTSDRSYQAQALTVRHSDNQALRVVASKSHRDAATDAYIGRYRVAHFLSAGSSLKFCLVASGEADFYPRLGQTMEWDTAAGDAILRGAGGQVLDFDTHAPLTYGKAGWKNPFFLASSGQVNLIHD